MNLLIIEDEPPIAEDIKEMSQSILGSKAERIDIRHTMEDALYYLSKHSIDLCLLDLNLRGENGYEILQTAVSKSFHTVIVSAHTEQAFEAFDYGILDFVPKPIDRRRLKTAFDRYFGTIEKMDTGIKYLVVRRRNSNHLISTDEIRYFEAQGYLVKLHLKDGKSELIEKPLNRLIQILPKKFLQVHRSYIVDVDEVDSYRHKGGGTYEIRLKSGENLPLSPKVYRQLSSTPDSD
jgi:two-component system response regulator LytT